MFFGNARIMLFNPGSSSAPTINDKLQLVVETTSGSKKSGIYSAERDDTSKPITIDWGDGTEVEQVNGDVSQKVHEYASAGTFNVVVENIKSYTASSSSMSWYMTTSQNYNTLKEVVAMPDSMTSIGNLAFYFCSKLTDVTIGNNITSIGDTAFGNCRGLTNVTIPDNVTSIEADAFFGCISITDVYCYPNPANLTWEESGCDDFKDDGSTICHVKAEYLTAYQDKFNGKVNVIFVGDLT